MSCNDEHIKHLEQDIEFLRNLMNQFVVGSSYFRACYLRIETKKSLINRLKGLDMEEQEFELDDLDIPEVEFEYEHNEDEGCEGGACRI